MEPSSTSPIETVQAERTSAASVLPEPGPRVLLTIAGFDPSSGAGVTADLKVFAAHRVYGLAVTTGLTVQSTRGVRGVEYVSPEYVRASLYSLVEDFHIDGIKIGMLGNGSVVREVVLFLQEFKVNHHAIPVVLDPVLQSSSGRELLSKAGVDELRERLLPLVSCVTPNRGELAVLTGEDDVPRAAAALLERGPSVVVTGGDLARPDDYVLTHTGEQWLRGERLETTADHGTGCAFSSALLCGLVQGTPVAEAALAAKQYVAGAMRAAYSLGHGRGPMHHLFTLDRP